MTHRDPTTENLLLLILQGVRAHLPAEALSFVDSRTRFCGGCGVPFFWRKADQIYCCSPCAVAAWRVANPHKKAASYQRLQAKRRATAIQAVELSANAPDRCYLCDQFIPCPCTL